VVDGAESELGILDLIQAGIGLMRLAFPLTYLDQVFVESLDRAFENVCELDLVFHFDEVVFSFFMESGC
jgi:AP-3 complex subunit sigma